MYDRNVRDELAIRFFEDNDINTEKMEIEQSGEMAAVCIRSRGSQFHAQMKKFITELEKSKSVNEMWEGWQDDVIDKIQYFLDGQVQMNGSGFASRVLPPKQKTWGSY